MKTLRLVLGMAVLALAAPGLQGDAGRLNAQTPLHNCSFCHNLHGASSSTGTLSNYDVIEDLCDSCHGASGPDSVFYDAIKKAVPKLSRNAEPDSLYFKVHNGQKHIDNSRAPTGCWDCHHHEAGAEGTGYTNFKMIQAAMPLPSSGTAVVEFTAWTGPNSFADSDTTTLSGVCEVCHTATTQHRSSTGVVPGRHNAATDCTTCHKHYSGFQGRGSCTTCHDTGGPGTTGPNNRRAIVPEFSRTSHHADGVSDADCEVCHDYDTRTGSHPQGAVTLWNVDFPADVDSAIVLSGDPQTSSTEAEKLTKFCIRCHDTNGANGTTAPFSDGTDRILIDETAWLASSHEGSAAIVGCYGDGAFGCHASGHGSQKANLLSPPETAATSPALAEQEEGFCFNCHDSDGPAGTDIEGAFASSILWVADVVGANDNVRLNDRHDVQYAAQDSSGAKIECTDCHDPHVASAAQPYKTDPDPGDGRVPGTGQVYSGVTQLSEFCMDCHDGSFPSSVVAPTTALNDVRTSSATDGMGGGSGNANLKPGYGYTSGGSGNMFVECAACHDPHVSGNLFHGVEVVMSVDGLTPVPSDGAPYALTDNSVKDATINGYNWCNTCHTGSMGDKKDNCSACHFHGTRW